MIVSVVQPIFILILRAQYPKNPPIIIIDVAKIPILTSVMYSSLVLIFTPEGNGLFLFLDFYKTTHFIINFSFHY